MELGPIWRASLRNKTGVVLIVLQIAFTMVLVVNAVAIAEERARLMARPSGIDEPDIFTLYSSGFDEDFDARLTIEEDLRQIRGLPGVDAAVQVNAFPLGGSGWSMGLKTEPVETLEAVPAAVYMVDEQGLDALGVELIAGQDFSEADVGWREASSTRWPDKTILTKSVAELLFPDDATYGVGRTVYIAGDQPMTVVGVVQTLQAPWSGWNNVDKSILVPDHLMSDRTGYLVRSAPGRRNGLMLEVEELLADREPGRIISEMRTMDETRERSYNGNGALVNVLTFTVVVLVAITTLGVAGLTSFNVTRRTKQIGTRRALGATRRDVLRYFLVENLLFSVIGVVLGAVLGTLVNFWLVETFSVPRFPWYLVPTTMIALVAIGVVAVIFPARRAARIPPAVATRTV